jgi:glycosyltransferase involved in cell wall biosynthesis
MRSFSEISMGLSGMAFSMSRTSRPAERPHLVVFFTRGMSLGGWHSAGILDRELALYRALIDDLGALTFVTYGGAGDAQWASKVPGLEVLPNRWRLPANLYSVVAPLLHWRRLRQATLFRTNQINGAWCAVVAKTLFRKPLVVRGGYVWAERQRHGTGCLRWLIVRMLQRLVIRSADRIIVAGKADADALARASPGRGDRIVVVPNYVDCSIFHPLPHVTPEPGRVLFVGRLEDVKNVGALIEAVATLPGVSLTLVGAGALQPGLERAASTSGARVEFLGRLPQDQIPALMCRSQALVLPSHYEGNPKVLFEAMACGVPVVGTRVRGIQDVIVDGVTGVLCGTSAGEIRSALERVLLDVGLRERLRNAALAWVRECCSLSLAVARERALLASFAGSSRPQSVARRGRDETVA